MIEKLAIPTVKFAIPIVIEKLGKFCSSERVIECLGKILG